MTLKETLDGFKEAVERQTSTVNGYSSKIDGLIATQAEMKIQQAVLCSQMKNIIDDNLEFKNNTDKTIETLKTDYDTTKSTVQKHSIFFTIIHFITVSVVGWLGFK